MSFINFSKRRLFSNNHSVRRLYNSCSFTSFSTEFSSINSKKNNIKNMIKKEKEFLNKFSSNLNFQSSTDSQINQLDDYMILVDFNDKKIGEISKFNGHLKSFKNEFPHRAFSLFLFNENKELLLQKRAESKLTFPNLWTNTCCSHPLPIKQEEEEIKGAKIAAARRLSFELGLDLDYSNFLLVDVVLYKSSYEESIFEEFESK